MRIGKAGLRLALLVSAGLMIGCVSTAQKAAQHDRRQEAVLQQSGFKAVPIKTPQQLQLVQSLPSGKLSVVRRNGARYYVYPDLAKQTLFVGGDDQFLRYQNYLSDQAENAQYDSISKSDPSVARYNNQAEILSGNERIAGWDDENWGSWDRE